MVRARRLAAGFLLGALTLSACGGPSRPSIPIVDTADESPGATSPSLPLFDPPRDTTAEMRFINFLRDPDGAPVDMLIYDTTPKPGGEVARVRFGEMSDYLKLPTDGRAVVDADFEGDHPQWRLNRHDPGDRFTAAMVSGPDRAPGHGGWSIGSSQLLFKDQEWEEAGADTATVMINKRAIEDLDGVNNLVIYYAAPGEGCLRDTSGRQSGFLGSTEGFYQVKPGTTRIAAMTNSCAGTSLTAPLEVEAKAGDRIVLIPYGTGPGDLQFFVLDGST